MPSARQLPNDQWSFGRCPDGKAKTVSNTDVCFPAGFSPELYLRADLRSARSGSARSRLRRYPRSDFISSLQRHREQSTRSGKETKAPRWAIGFGSSQSGRFLQRLDLSRIQSGRSRKNRFRRRDPAYLRVAPHVYKLRIRHAWPLPHGLGRALHSGRSVSRSPMKRSPIRSARKPTAGWRAAGSKMLVRKSCTGTRARSLGKGETRSSSATRWGRKTCRYRTTCGFIISPARNMVPRINQNAASASNSPIHFPIKKRSAR